jgi:hypothetical protein
MIHEVTLRDQIVLFLMLILFCCPAVLARGVSLYRCDIHGEIEFRQTACEEGDESLQRVTNTSGGLSPSEPGLRLKHTSEKSGTVSRTKSRQASELQCWKKRQALQRVERKLRTGYRASEYQRLHDRQREYEDYLRRFCR